jgi:hypothetical protein
LFCLNPKNCPVLTTENQGKLVITGRKIFVWVESPLNHKIALYYLFWDYRNEGRHRGGREAEGGARKEPFTMEKMNSL